MKLLLCTFTSAPQVNGVAEVVRAHATGLARSGHEVTIATGFDENRNMVVAGSGNPRVEQFRVTGDARTGFRGEVERYREFVANWRGDVMLFHCLQTWVTDTLLDGVLGKVTARKVMVSHGFIVHRYPLGCIFPFGLRTWLGWQPYVRRLAQNLTQFDHLVFLAPLANHGPYYDRLVATQTGLPNISEIPSGTDLGHFTQEQPDFRRKFGLTEPQMVLCVSEYSRLKNQKLALSAFQRAAVPNSVLVFIGRAFNDYSAQLAQLVESAALRRQRQRVVLLAGLPRTEVMAAGRAADLSLCASKWESGPLVVLEAMAARTAFVSSDVGFVSQLPGGRVVRGEAEMAEDIRDLLRNDSERERLAAAGRAACEQTYNWPMIIAQYESLLRQLVGAV